MMNSSTGAIANCNELFLSLRDAADIWGGKWKIQIILYLFVNRSKPIYFTQMRQDITGISSKMLSKELKDLELNQLVTRKVHADRPVKVEYLITAHGESFAAIAETMIVWGVQHRKLVMPKATPGCN